MYLYISVALVCFAVALLLISSSSSTCTVVITGESAKVFGCVIDREFAEAVDKIKPFCCGTLG
nr:triple gene block protein 3 [Cole mild mosaic virus]